MPTKVCLSHHNTASHLVLQDWRDHKNCYKYAAHKSQCHIATYCLFKYYRFKKEGHTQPLEIINGYQFRVFIKSDPEHLAVSNELDGSQVQVLRVM